MNLFIKFDQNTTYDDFIKTLRENKNIPHEQIKLNHMFRKFWKKISYRVLSRL